MSIVLRVDPPYQGESMSSFLGRAAQFYAMHPRVLASTLLDGAKWTGAGRPDLDLRPPEVLEDRLASAVRDWRSPLDGWSGFLGWVLAPSERRAYCPTCFGEDLDSGRTPFFRIDWAPVLVTSCWSHKTPLFNWEAVDSAGVRMLPKEWIYRLDQFRSVVPEFMRGHLTSIEALKTPGESEPDVRPILQVISRIQSLVEKSGHTQTTQSGYRRTLMDCFRRDFCFAVEKSARFDSGSRSAPLADVARPAAWPGWFGSIPETARRRTPEFSAFGLRQTGCVQWRRTLQFFTIQALQCLPAYAAAGELRDVWAIPFVDTDVSFTQKLEPDQLEMWQRIQAVLYGQAVEGVG